MRRFDSRLQGADPIRRRVANESTLQLDEIRNDRSADGGKPKLPGNNLLPGESRFREFAPYINGHCDWTLGILPSGFAGDSDSDDIRTPSPMPRLTIVGGALLPHRALVRPCHMKGREKIDGLGGVNK